MKVRNIGLAFLVASTMFIAGCADKKIGDLSQVEMESIVNNLPGKDRELFKQYIARNQLQHVMVNAMGSKAEKEALKPYDQVSVKEAIKIEKEFMEKGGKK